MAGLTARAARIGFGTGFDVGLQLRRQRFNESLSLRASGRAERSLQLQEDRLALQKEEFANETFSVPQLNSFNQELVRHMEAAPSNELSKDPNTRFVNPDDTASAIEGFKGLIKFDLLGANKQDQINRQIDFLRRTGLPPEFDTKGKVKFQGRRFSQITPEQEAIISDVQAQSDAAIQAGTFGEQDISDDITQLSDTDFDELERQGQPAFRSVTAPNPREESAFRGGSFR